MIWRIFLQKARNKNASGDLDGAFSELEKMLKFHPSVNAKVLYGYWLLKADRPQKASEIFEKHVMNDRRVTKPDKRNKEGKLIVNPSEILAKTNYALCKWKNGDLKGATELLEYVYGRARNTDLYCNLGYLYVLGGNYEKALKFNLKAYDFSPEHNGICDNLGCTYIKLGKFEEAREVYEEIFEHKKKPKFPECYYNYALVLKQAGEYKKAAEQLETALQLEFDGFTNVLRETVEKELEEVKSKIL